jgi:hypothetical protein
MADRITPRRPFVHTHKFSAEISIWMLRPWSNFRAISSAQRRTILRRIGKSRWNTGISYCLAENTSNIELFLPISVFFSGNSYYAVKLWCTTDISLCEELNRGCHPCWCYFSNRSVVSMVGIVFTKRCSPATDNGQPIHSTVITVWK